MSKPVLIGFPQSTYMWAARAALEYKGVEHEMRPIAPPEHKSAEFLARHPWGKVPVFEHGDVELYETPAICAYIDAAFDGPALTPTDAAGIGRMQQIISIVNCYLYPPAVLRFILQYIFPSGPDGKPNEAVIEAAKPEVRRTLEVLDGMLGTSKWFCGEQPTLADLFAGPLLLSIGHFPGGEQLFDNLANLGRLRSQLVNEPKFMAAAPKT